MGRAADIVINCLNKKKLSQSKLASSMGEDVRYLNQQIRRQKDMKVDRFVDVLDHIGYRVEVVDNDGIKKVCEEYAKQIIETGEPKGFFWCLSNNTYIAVDSTRSKVLCETFQDKEECFKWFRHERHNGTLC